jgi:hypothetical protein
VSIIFERDVHEENCVNISFYLCFNTIDGQYGYLFYESLQYDNCQYSFGWVVACRDLENFFRDNTTQTGFIEQEINDFIEYWIPKLQEYPYYAIYPQYNKELDEMIQLKFSTEPTNLIRLIYTLKGLKTNTMTLKAPVVPSSSRDGFTVETSE